MTRLVRSVLRGTLAGPLSHRTIHNFTQSWRLCLYFQQFEQEKLGAHTLLRRGEGRREKGEGRKKKQETRNKKKSRKIRRKKGRRKNIRRRKEGRKKGCTCWSVLVCAVARSRVQPCVTFFCARGHCSVTSPKPSTVRCFPSLWA